jgi:hypothetical protein
MSESPPTIVPPPRPTAVAIVGTDLVLAAFPATPVQIAHALHRIGFDVVVPASWGDELLAAATLARLEERGGVPAVYCACPRVAERLLATGGELAPVLLPLVSPPVAAARYVRAAYEGSQVTVTFLGGCCGATDDSIDARITPREFLRTLHDRDIVLGELPRVFESVIPPDRRRHLSLPGGLPDPAQLASLGVPRELACLTSADYAAELAQLVIAREPVLIDVAARLGCACVGATSSTPFERAHETVTRLEPPRAAHPVVDATLAGPLDATLPEPPARPEPAPEPADPRAARGGVRTPTPPRAMPATGGAAGPRSVQHTPPSQSRYPTGEPATGPTSRRRGGVTGFFRGVGSAEAPPRARTGEGMALPRAYVAKRRPAGDGARNSGEREAAAARTGDERELPIARHVEPPATPTPPAMPAFVAPPAVSPTVVHASGAAEAPAARTTAAVLRAIATPPAAEVPLPKSPEARGNGAGANGGALHAVHAEPPTRPTVPPSRRATAVMTPIVEPPVVPSASTMPVTAAVPDAPTEGDDGDVPAAAPAAAPTPPTAPALPTLPTVGSGRELVFFVVGALLAGLAFALFR